MTAVTPGKRGDADGLPVSVVIPVHNHYDILKDCLDALQNQTIIDRLEIVVSLDGGDPPPEWLGGIADRVVSGPHSGPAAARNRGWMDSSGKYILFTDSDCVPQPDWAMQMVRTLEEGADAGGLGQQEL